MFDLLSFIRQLLPPPLRLPVSLGLVRVLYSPVMALFDAVQQANSDTVSTASSTGQVAVLEDLLNQATFGSGVGAVYILDGDGVNYDFQVVTPAGLPLDTLNRMNDILTTHHLLGKRFVVQNQVAYIQDRPVVGQSVSWVTGYPYREGNKLHFAVNERGSFRVKIDAPTYSLIDAIYTLNGATDDEYVGDLDSSLAYTITILNLTKTLAPPAAAPAPTTPGTKGLTRMGYSRFVTSHQTSLWFITDRPMKATVSLVSGSASGDGWSTAVARVIDTAQTLREWTSGLRLNPTANGQGGILDGVTYYITITESDGTNPVTYAWTPQGSDTNGILDIPLAPTAIPTKPANRAPYVATALNNQVITDAGDQVWDVPVNTFSDPDGDTLTLGGAANGGGALPAGVTFDAQNRRFGFAASLANGTYNVQVTATDPYGASVTATVSVTIGRAAVVAPVAGSFDVVYADHNAGGGVTRMLQISPTWRTDSSGKNWVTLHDSATPPVPGGYTRYYLLDEDGVPNAAMGWNAWTGSLADFGEFPERFVVYVQVIVAKGTNFVDYPDANNSYKYSSGFAQIFTGTKP